MIKAYKTQINPTKEQIELIEKTFGVCRYVYNMYLHYNQEEYKATGKFVSGYTFSKYLNNEFRIEHPECSWIQEVSSKAVKQTIINGETAFKRFFKHQSGFPKFKKKGKNESFYLIGTIRVNENKIQLPKLKNVKLYEKNYIPTDKKIKSCTITKKAGKYYVSCLVEEENTIVNDNFTEGIGIDLGIKDFATLSNGVVYKNINKTNKVKKIEKKLKREQKRLSRKLENNKKGGIATRKNLDKQILKIECIHNKLYNIRTDYINKTISEIVKAKPSFIVIEDLNVSGMIKNRHLSKAIAQQKFYEFRIKLLNKCHEFRIEFRIADRFFPSSKTCSHCGNIKSDLRLKDRVYSCEHCGTIIDRDLNASINLKNTDRYKIA